MNENELLIAELGNLIKYIDAQRDSQCTLFTEYNSQGNKDKALMHIMINEAYRECIVELKSILWKYKIRKEQNER